MLRGMLRQFGFGSGRGRRELHQGYDFFTTFRPFDCPSNDGGTHHRWMRIQHCLDFRRIDIFPETDDQFLGPANDEKISVFETSKIAGVEPSFWY
jgi:hypothetical protein